VNSVPDQPDSLINKLDAVVTELLELLGSMHHETRALRKRVTELEERVDAFTANRETWALRQRVTELEERVDAFTGHLDRAAGGPWQP
jgi:phage shock protein A